MSSNIYMEEQTRWAMEVYASIGMYHPSQFSTQKIVFVEDGEMKKDDTKIVMEGPSGSKLAERFCMEVVIPGSSNGRNTKDRVRDLFISKDWKSMLDVYMNNPADLFWPPDKMRIFNKKTGDKYYECW